MKTSKIKSTLLEAIETAGKIVKRAFGKKQRITQKGEFNIVTETDKARKGRSRCHPEKLPPPFHPRGRISRSAWFGWLLDH
ncbi:MAG TPA: hypothetical protein PLX96_05140 [Candidatus Omnitrophota bacterium]|nr:hypothetical protein [Candidatus Omnitrophota bacterium]